MIALDRLEQIIPADQALAMKSLATSLTQIGGISQLNLQQLSAVVGAQQTTRDLPLVTALTQPVPTSVATYFSSTIATGTGPDGTIVVVDLLGTAAGWISADAFARTVEILATMNTTALQTVYETMLDVVTGVYGDPVTGPVDILTGPYAGTYTDANEVFSTVLIPAAQSEISALVVAYPNQVSELNTLWNNVGTQLVRENTLQAAASLNFADLTANQRNSIYGLVYALPTYGLNQQVGGPTQLIEGVADLPTFTGQCIVACLREGRNTQALEQAGIVVSNKIPEDPAEPPPQAQLIPSEYTEAEAANLVVK
jgi:hypothetical protein